MLPARQLFEQIVQSLQTIYEPEEARSIAFLLIEKKMGANRTAVLANQKISVENETLLSEWLRRLQAHEPIQYVLGETEFYGRKFFVNENVLIPRPETEELVTWVLENSIFQKSENPTLLEQPFRILDIGTGSGCIAVTLAAEVPQAEVWAVDISPEALAVAQQNARLHGTPVHFCEFDFLSSYSPPHFPPTFDLVVSNPPYVTESEKSQMQFNVLDYEPHTALFVPDDDALVFYRAIAALCQQRLAPGGSYYIEINENLAEATATLFRSFGLSATCRNDIFGKSRMVSGIKI